MRKPPANSRKKWTTEEINLLRQFAGLNTTWAIGVKLYRSEQAVRSKACRLGISLKDRTQALEPSPKKKT
jgi:hypothetical protein